MSISKNFSVAFASALVFIGSIIIAPPLRASTYVVYLPLDDPVYDELSTLNGLGVLDSYLEEIRPISRVEAARLTLEAERNVQRSQDGDPLAATLISKLRSELADEIGLPVDYGLLIVQAVPGGSADRAGLRGGAERAYLGNTPIMIGGDLIVAIDGEKVESQQILAQIDQETRIHISTLGGLIQNFEPLIQLITLQIKLGEIAVAEQ